MAAHQSIDAQADHRGPLPRLRDEGPDPNARHHPTGRTQPPPRRAVHRRPTRRGTRTGHPAALCRHPVQRPHRRRPATTAPPQPRPVRPGPPTTRIRAHLLVTDRGREVPALLPRPRRPTRRPVRTHHRHRRAQRRDTRPALARHPPRRPRRLHPPHPVQHQPHHPVLTTPKAKNSRTWIGLSDRVVTALHRQRLRQPGRDLVFSRRDGNPLRPEYVLHHFHHLTAAAGLPRSRVHDLRDFAATTMLNSRIPLAVISRAMRHSTLSTTTEVYGHLLRHVAHDAVDVIADALNEADAA
ncbi:tyrosine-type recombinase/integrase [Saccharothrix stipae]